jgi:hypothetical protein
MNTLDALATARTRDVRLVTAGLFGAAAVWPLLPVHPPLACPLRSTTGIPCPFCGLTRACVAAAHGDLLRSLSFNPAGILVLTLAVILLVRPALMRRIRPPIWAQWATLGVLWFWNIGFNPTFHQLIWR